MRTIFKVLFFFALTLIISVLLGLYLLNWYGVKKIKEGANGISEQGIQYRSQIEMNVIPTPYFVAREVEFTNPNHTTKKLATLQLAEFRFSWLPLFKNQLIIDDILIKGLDIYIDFDANGKSNWGESKDIKTQSSQVMSSPDVNRNVNKAKGLDKFIVKRFHFEDINVYYRDSKANIIKRFKLQDFTINNESDDHTGFTINMQIDDFMFALNTKIKMLLQEKTVDFTDISMNIQNNLVTGSGSIIMRSAPFFDWNFKAPSFNIDEISKATQTLKIQPRAMQTSTALSSDTKMSSSDIMLILLSNFSSHMSFESPKVTYENKLYSDVKLDVVFKNGQVQMNPCLPVWLKNSPVWFEKQGMPVKVIEKAPKTQTWCY